MIEEENRFVVILIGRGAPLQSLSPEFGTGLSLSSRRSGIFDCCTGSRHGWHGALRRPSGESHIL